MKTYEKPRLMVLSFTASDALCSGCAAPTRGTGLAGVIENAFVDIYPDQITPDGNLTQAEIEAIGLFAAATESCTNDALGYCTNTPAGNNIFTS